MTVEIKQVQSSSEMKKFIYFPWRIYKDDPFWVPPLLRFEKKLLDRKSHPFHHHAKVEYYLAYKDGLLAGRIAAIKNNEHNKFHKDKVGFWGFFEVINDQEVAQHLIGAAENWLSAEGLTSARGPANFSVNETVGMLIDGFNRSPFVMMTHNPPYYPQLVEGAGYKKAIDLFAYYTSVKDIKLEVIQAAQKLFANGKVKFRPFDLKHFDIEIQMVTTIYNDAWSSNWGFVPMTQDEVLHMAKELKQLVTKFPEMGIIAEADNMPIAFVLSLPDINEIIKKTNGRLFPFGWIKFLTGLGNIKSVRTLLLGVKKANQHKGIGLVLILKTIEAASKRGIIGGEMSWILETNRAMLNPLEKMGTKIHKTYRIYEKNFAGA